MKTVKLVFPGEPRAIQSVRSCVVGGHARHFQPKRNEDWKSYIRVSAQSQLPEGWRPADGPVEIARARFLFAPPKSLKKRDRLVLESGALLPKTTRPDLHDNLFKGLMDALSGIVFADDARIWAMDSVYKAYTLGAPRIEIAFVFPQIPEDAG